MLASAALPLPGNVLQVGLPGDLPAEEGLLRLTVELGAPTGAACISEDPAELVLQASSTVTYVVEEGASASRISGFLPPMLDRLHVVVPAPVSPEAAQAALSLAALMARRYAGATPVVEVRTTPAPSSGPASPFERTVRWAPGVTAHLAREEGRDVLVVGKAGDVPLLFEAERGPRGALPMRSARPIGALAPARRALEELGYGPRTLTGTGLLQVRYPFALADLGAGMRPDRFQLQLQHALMAPGSIANAQVFLNSVLLGSTPVRGTATSVAVVVPTAALRAANVLEVRIEHSEPGGACRPGAPPFSAIIAPGSAFRLARGHALKPGKGRFPQALLPSFGVQIAPLDGPHLDQAVRLVSALQATTRLPLVPRLDSAGTRRGAVLAVGDTALARQLGAPLHAPGFRLSDRDGRTWLRLDPRTRYASLQAFESQGRDVLMLMETAPEDHLGSDLLEAVLAPDGWAGVEGDLVVQGPGGEPVAVGGGDRDARVLPFEEVRPLLGRFRAVAFIEIALLVLTSLVALFRRVVSRGGMVALAPDATSP